jgi:regulator of protease activity HflC (stomatin/prohibitin superfamily)
MATTTMRMREPDQLPPQKRGYSTYDKLKIVGGFIIALLLIIVFFMTNFTVGQNEVAVVTTWGRLSYVAGPGLHFKVPFVNDAYVYRTDLQSLSSTGKVNTYTIDNQEVDIQFTVFYQIPNEQIEYIFGHNRDYKERLVSLTIDRVKAAMGQVNVQQVAEKRGELRDKIRDTLKHDAAPLGVEVIDFQLPELQYTDAFRNAVNNAAVQKANIESIEYQRQQSEKTAAMVQIQAAGAANATREAARGAADARLLQATAEARAIQLQGEAQATAIKAQTEALASNTKLVELRKAERWDGRLPQSMLSNVVPFMNVDQGAK